MCSLRPISILFRNEIFLSAVNNVAKKSKIEIPLRLVSLGDLIGLGIAISFNYIHNVIQSKF